MSKSLTVLSDAVSAEVLPPEVAETIAELAFASSRWPLLARLAARTDLPAELDARLAEVSTLEVRVAWLGRPGRSLEELSTVLASERRQTALAELAATEGLPDEVYELVATYADGPTALTALVCGPAPLPVRTAALSRLAAAPRKLSFARVTQVNQVIAQHPEMLAAVLSSSEMPELLVEHLDAVEDPAPEVVARVRRVVVDAAVALPAAKEDNWHVTQRLATALRDGPVMWWVRHAPRVELAEVAAAAAATAAAIGTDPKSEVGLLVARLAHLAAGDDIEARIAARIVDGDDPVAAARELVQVASTATYPAAAATAARSVVGDPGVPTAALDVLLGTWPKLAELAVPTIGAGDLDRAVVVASAAPTAEQAWAALCQFGDPAAALHHWLTVTSVTPLTRVSVVRASGVAVDAALVECLPVWLVLSRPRGQGFASLASQVSVLLVVRLGADRRRWSLFAELADPSMRIGELLGLVEAAHVAEDTMAG